MYADLTLSQFIAAAGMHFVISLMLARGAYILARDGLWLLYRVTAPPPPRVVYMRRRAK